jgi:hypothetical protein
LFYITLIVLAIRPTSKNFDLMSWLGFSIQRELAATTQGAWGHPAGIINLKA